MLKERTRRTRAATLDLDLAQRAERKLNRYNMDLNGVLAFIVAVRGLPDLRNAPQTMDFTARPFAGMMTASPRPTRFQSCARISSKSRRPWCLAWARRWRDETADRATRQQAAAAGYAAFDIQACGTDPADVTGYKYLSIC